MTKKISHFGILVHDADAATALWTGSFGLQKFDDRRIDVEVSGIQWIQRHDVPRVHGVEPFPNAARMFPWRDRFFDRLHRQGCSDSDE